MVWLPADRPDVPMLAVVVPPVLVSVCWAMIVPPSRKFTTPVGLTVAGLPVPVTVTVAVNVTAWPDDVGLAEAITVAPVLALVTDCPPTRALLLLAKVLSPR